MLNAWRLEEVNAQAAAWRPEQQFSKGLSERYLTLNSQHVRLAFTHHHIYFVKYRATFVKKQPVAWDAFDWCDMVVTW